MEKPPKHVSIVWKTGRTQRWAPGGAVGLEVREGPALDVFGQMAADEFSLERDGSAGLDGLAVLRLYRWAGRPWYSFGFAQRAEAVRRELGEERWARCTRRPTGGGIVEHEGDVTFSVVFDGGGRRSEAIYEALHAGLGRSLGRLAGGIRSCRPGEGGGASSSSAAGGGGGGSASRCFREPVAWDLLGADGGKVLGGAMRRRRGAVLYQGSLRWAGVGAEALAAVESAVVEGVAAALAADECHRVRWDPREEVGWGERAAKYRSREWIERR